ncbi:MAG: 3-deoxy-8-phosphooctulonate synthase [Planctomycetota bacterium]
MSPQTPETAICTVGPVEIGPGKPLAIIAGPCLLESKELGLEVGTKMRNACQELGLGYIFKASFDKANRSSIDSPRGPGLTQGLAWLAEIRETLGVPATTDLHEPAQADPVSEVIDLLQIPAFLARQTDLLVATGQAAARRGRAVNVKKGQFMAPGAMKGPVRKLAEAGCTNVMLTDRGTFFGYERLVNDFVGLGEMMELDVSDLPNDGPPPVCLDVTHSCQRPGSGNTTDGDRKHAPLLARAGVAAGVDALFIEVHTDPKSAMSDSSTQLTPGSATEVLRTLPSIRHALPE